MYFLMQVSLATNLHWAIKYLREGKTVARPRLEPRALAYRASSLPTELTSHLVVLWHKMRDFFHVTLQINNNDNNTNKTLVQ